MTRRFRFQTPRAGLLTCGPGSRLPSRFPIGSARLRPAYSDGIVPELHRIPFSPASLRAPARRYFYTWILQSCCALVNTFLASFTKYSNINKFIPISLVLFYTFPLCDFPCFWCISNIFFAHSGSPLRCATKSLLSKKEPPPCSFKARRRKMLS